MSLLSTELKLMKLIRHIILSLLLILPLFSRAQEFAIKNNLLYDATTTPNIGAELSVGSRSSINLVYGFNPWKFKSDSGDRQFRHWVLSPEYRYWFCTQFDGHFVGVNLMGGQLNAGNINVPFPGTFFGGDNIAKGMRDHRYEAWFLGAGVSYGYQWVLSKHWNLEAEIGVGYNYLDYRKYRCADCAGKIGEGSTNYLGLTKLGVSFLYLF